MCEPALPIPGDDAYIIGSTEQRPCSMTPVSTILPLSDVHIMTLD